MITSPSVETRIKRNDILDRSTNTIQDTINFTSW